MALKVPKANNIQLFKDGYKYLQGVDEAVLRNIQAINELSDLVRTSFGPNGAFNHSLIADKDPDEYSLGRNKLVINHLGRIFVTSDAATIIREIEVVHPAAKLLVMASQAQEAEMGDATNLVLILAGELLKKSEHLLVIGLHPSEIIRGYELACKKALEELESLPTQSLPLPLTRSSLASALKPAIASKHYGVEETLADLVAEAALAVMPPVPKNFNVDNVRVVKIMGGSLGMSKVLKGMVFGREPEGTIRKFTSGKVAVFTSAIDISQTETKGTVLLKNADEMLNFTTGEEKLLEKIISEIAAVGIKLIIAGSAVGDLALHYLNRNNIAVIKVLSKFDLRRVSRVVGATPLARLGAPTPEESGWVDVFECVEVGGDKVCVLRQLDEGEEYAGVKGKGNKTLTSTILLRGATPTHLDNLERAIDDGVNTLKGLLKDSRLVPGAGASEIELARRVQIYGAGLKGLAQHAVKRYAEALEVIPKTIAENTFGGAQGNEIVRRLWAKHEAESGEGWGVDVEATDDGTISTTSLALSYPILDSLPAKQHAIKLATEAAVSVLSVDSIIMSKPAGGPKIPQQAGNWDEDD